VVAAELVVGAAVGGPDVGALIFGAVGVGAKGELEVSGKPGAGAGHRCPRLRGLAFRSNADGSKYECAYIRPTKRRANDQLRRNHSAQYISIPEYEWFRLRNETPGKYESYADMLPDEWIKLRIEVSGCKNAALRQWRCPAHPHRQRPQAR